jgi:hypothetical protein
MVSPVVGGLIVVSGFAMLFVAVALIGLAALMLTVARPPDRSAQQPTWTKTTTSRGILPCRVPHVRLLRWYAVTVVNMFFVSILFGSCRCARPARPRRAGCLSRWWRSATCWCNPWRAGWRTTNVARPSGSDSSCRLA